MYGLYIQDEQDLLKNVKKLAEAPVALQSVGQPYPAVGIARLQWQLRLAVVSAVDLDI